MNPLRKAVTFLQAQKNFDKIKASVDFETCGPDALLPLIAARDLRDAARKPYGRLPCDARRDAMDQVEHAKVLSRYWGAELSGKCTRVLEWGTSVSASSATSKGSRYPGKAWHKTDVVHTITLCPETFPSIHFIRSDARRRSNEDGLAIIADHGKDEYTWLVVKAGKLSTQRGWFVYRDGETFHSTKSRDHAVRSLDKKIRIKRAEKKASRRERLVARLCKNTTATLADAKALGYCDPGIAAFQSRHGIGDTATLPQLMATGDPSAVRLALTLARKI